MKCWVDCTGRTRFWKLLLLILFNFQATTTVGLASCDLCARCTNRWPGSFTSSTSSSAFEGGSFRAPGLQVFCWVSLMLVWEKWLNCGNSIWSSIRVDFFPWTHCYRRSREKGVKIFPFLPFGLFSVILLLTSFKFWLWWWSQESRDRKQFLPHCW